MHVVWFIQYNDINNNYIDLYNQGTVVYVAMMLMKTLHVYATHHANKAFTCTTWHQSSSIICM